MQPTTSLNLDNLKPGDKILKKFQFKNSGTLDIKDVLMKVDYTVNDLKQNNITEDFGEHIKITIPLGLGSSKKPCIRNNSCRTKITKSRDCFQESILFQVG